MRISDFFFFLQHVGVPTNDIERTKAFYEQLGFQLVMQTANGDEQVAFLQLHNLVIETYQNYAATMRSGAIDHIAIDVKQIDALYEQAQAMDLTILEGGLQSLPFWERGIKYFIILGPNNEKIEFCERL